MTMNNTFTMVAKTVFGLEEILADELKAIGAGNINPMNRSVEFTGDMAILYKANLHLRCAGRILKPILSFKASHKSKYYKEIQKLNWSDYIGLRQTFAIDAIVFNSCFDNSLYAAQLAKDAIVDQFRKDTGKRPSIDKEDPDIRINLYMNNNEVTLSLDSSNIPLHKRGYRSSGGKAPINEILAAGIIYLTGWDCQSAFFDGMCGSGTFVIEAALKARNIAPGLIRKQFGFMKWKDYNRSLFKKISANALENIKESLPVKIIGSDMNKAILKEAKSNARRAGVENDITFDTKKFEDQTPPEQPGILVINPPYGERMPLDEISQFYKMIGDCLKQKYSGYEAFILTGNMKAAKSIGLRTSRRIQLYNGPIECRLLKFDIYEGSRKKKYQQTNNESSG